MFHIIKRSRIYNGFPYSGPSNDFKPAEFSTLAEAREALEILTYKNPVGWDIYESVSGELVVIL